MKIPKMLADLALIKPSEKRVTKGGIHLPQSVIGVSALRGIVEAVGPDCNTVKVGDDVSFATYSKYLVPEEEGPFKNHFLIYEKDLLIVWEEDGISETPKNGVSGIGE